MRAMKGQASDKLMVIKLFILIMQEILCLYLLLLYIGYEQ